MKKRITAILLVALMTVSLLGGITVSAEEATVYTYSFITNDYASGILSYKGMPRFSEYSSETYAADQRNWKYLGMSDATYEKWEDSISSNDGRSRAGFDAGGIRFTPAATSEWFALTLRVPEPGFYKLSYMAPINITGLTTKGTISIFPEGTTEAKIESYTNTVFTSGNLLQHKSVDFNSTESTSVERAVGTNVIAINGENGGEIVVAVGFSETKAARFRGFKLTKVSDEMVLSTDAVNLEVDGENEIVTATLKTNTLQKSLAPDFEIADTKIATVKANGAVSPVAAGETTLKVMLGDCVQTIPVIVAGEEVPAETPEYVEAFTPDETAVSPVTNSVAALAIAKDGSALEVTKSVVKNANGTYSVKADAESGDYKFLYWAKGLENGGKKRIVSFDASFTYAPHNGANYLIAVYGKSGDEASKNEYYNANGQLLENGETLPSMAGYGTAKGWVDCGDGIFVAEYNEAPTESFNITVNGKTEKYAYGEKVECTADAKNGDKVFFGWRKTINSKAELVSINTEYSFNAWEDCTVEAVYADEAGVFSGLARKIVLGTFNVGGKSAIMAEFIGFTNVAEKGISLGNSDIAMSTNGNQFTIINDIDATNVSGYAILSDGTKVIYK